MVLEIMKEYLVRRIALILVLIIGSCQGSLFTIYAKEGEVSYDQALETESIGSYESPESGFLSDSFSGSKSGSLSLESVDFSKNEEIEEFSYEGSEPIPEIRYAGEGDQDGLAISAASEDLIKYIVPINEQSFPDEKFRAYLTGESEKRNWVLPNGQKYILTPSFNYCVCENMGIESLSGIEKLPYVAVLKCRRNSISSLSIGSNAYLQYLDCSYNKLNGLDVSKNPGLQALMVSHNSITELDISNNKRLVGFACTFNGIGLLDFRGNTVIDPFQNDKFNVAMQQGSLTILCDRGSKMEEFCRLYLYSYAYEYLAPRGKGLLSGNSLEIAKGEKVDLKGVLLLDKDGARSLISSDKSIASIDKKGVIKGKRAGKARLTGTAKRNGVSVPIDIEISVFKPSFDVKKLKASSLLEEVDLWKYISGTAYNADSYKSSKPDVLDVDPATGKLIPKKKGSAKVKAYYGTGKNAASISIKVKSAVPHLNKEKLDLKRGKSYKMRVKDFDGGVVWRSADPTIVSVDYSSGMLQGISRGTVNVSAILYYGTKDQTELTCKVTVT